MGTIPKIALSKNQIQEIDSFSVAMIGNHRNYRSGGQLHRTEHQIFLDDKVGKTAEFILYRFLKLNGLIVSKQPDLHVYPLSEWDAGFDLEVTTSKGKKWRIDVKGSGPKAHNLMIERKDWSVSADGNKYKLKKSSSDLTPSFWFAVNVDSDMKSGTIHGYIPQQLLINAIKDAENHHTYFQGQNIPGTNQDLDADNYIWGYEELWDPINFLKYYKNN
ncbi:hypothetical protein PL111_1069 [Leuconostoc inhae]|uniref:Uncharacterized protein n=1 Tax=Leuconostoc inhae TaxID=178001 RepID=A0AAN2QX68_9LACO|nr:hypothetical protein [Leuconostoc inhae]CUW19495.1 hypothetical protein PL111_1069 [Leuconostoc inhae]